MITSDSAIRLPQNIADRSLGIGGSDAGTALGLNPWKTEGRLFDEKIGIVTPSDLSENEAVELGTLLEDDVATVYERRSGNKTHFINATLQSAQHPFMLANVDRGIYGTKKFFEAKTTNQFSFALNYGDPDEDSTAIPSVALAQIQHTLSVQPKFEAADLAVLVAGQKVKLYLDIAPDPAFIEPMIEMERDLWNRVLKGREILDQMAREYETDGMHLAEFLRSGAAADSLVDAVEHELRSIRPAPRTYEEATRRFPRSKLESPIAATDEIKTTFLRFVHLKEQEAAAKIEMDKLQCALGAYLGDDYDTLTIAGNPVLTWKSQSAQRLDIKSHAVGAADCHARFLKTSFSRVMRRVSDKKKAKK